MPRWEEVSIPDRSYHARERLRIADTGKDSRLSDHRGMADNQV
jgi:hypothetical protein